MDILAHAWGKFRNWERAQTRRLARQDLQGASAAFEALKRLEGKPTKAELLGILELLPGPQQAGGKLFYAWLAKNREDLGRVQVAGINESASSEDSIQVQLL